MAHSVNARPAENRSARPHPGTTLERRPPARPVWRFPRKRAGSEIGAAPAFTLIQLLLILAIAGILAGTLAPNLIRRTNVAARQTETAKLAEFSGALQHAIQRTQVIPGTNTWITTVATEIQRSTNEVQQVYPEFPADTTIRREFLIDPAFTPATGPSLLPYTQTSAGIDQLSLNAPGPNSRVMLVSSSKRGLALPVTSGAPGATVFSNLWNWSYDPVTEAPPAGWPAAWNEQGRFLQVERINVASLFQPVGLKNLRYTTNNAGSMVAVASEVSRYFLAGTLLTIFPTTNTTVFTAETVTRHVRFDLTPSTGAPPRIWFKFAETNGIVATNSGALGSALNGTYQNGILLARIGPRPPTAPALSTNNLAVQLDGVDDCVTTTAGVCTNLDTFTLAGWIRPNALAMPSRAFFGQRDAVVVGSWTPGKVGVWTKVGGVKEVTYPFAMNQWHHVAAVGDGTFLRMYLDGQLAGLLIKATDNYSVTNAQTFRVGGGLFAASGDYFQGQLDEVVFYSRALGTNELAQLQAGTLP